MYYTPLFHEFHEIKLTHPITVDLFNPDGSFKCGFIPQWFKDDLLDGLYIDYDDMNEIFEENKQRWLDELIDYTNNVLETLTITKDDFNSDGSFKHLEVPKRVIDEMNSSGDMDTFDPKTQVVIGMYLSEPEMISYSHEINFFKDYTLVYSNEEGEKETLVERMDGGKLLDYLVNLNLSKSNGGEEFIINTGEKVKTIICYHHPGVETHEK